MILKPKEGKKRENEQNKPEAVALFALDEFKQAPLPVIPSSQVVPQLVAQGVQDFPKNPFAHASIQPDQKKKKKKKRSNQ